MPFIDLRTTVPAAPEQREALKAAFGMAITALHKTETYLMSRSRTTASSGWAARSWNKAPTWPSACTARPPPPTTTG